MTPPFKLFLLVLGICLLILGCASCAGIPDYYPPPPKPKPCDKRVVYQGEVTCFTNAEWVEWVRRSGL